MSDFLSFLGMLCFCISLPLSTTRRSKYIIRLKYDIVLAINPIHHRKKKGKVEEADDCR